MCWAIQFAFVQGILVGCQHSIDPVALGGKDVTVEGKAMSCSFHWIYLTSEAVCWNLFIVVVVLQNTSYCLDGLVVLIVAEIPGV